MESNRTPPITWVLAVTLAVAASLVIVLSIRVTEGRDRILEERRAELIPRVGMYVPTFLAPDINGTTHAIGRSPEDGPQLLFLFSVTCTFSEASLPAWRALAVWADSLGPASVVVRGISVDSLPSTRNYAVEHALPFPVVTFPEEKLHWLYRATVTPHTLVLDPEGLVLFVHTGELEEGPALDSIRAVIGSLPPGQATIRPAPSTQEGS